MQTEFASDTPQNVMAAANMAEEPQGNVPGPSSADIVSWVMNRVFRWRNHRDANYQTQWDRYYNIWRGTWSADLKNKDIERSKIITPATQQAIDQSVAEMVEAVFGRGNWFDITDTPDDPQQKMLAEIMRDRLIEDFDRDGIKSVIIETFTNGAVFGTGIAKRVIEAYEYEDVGQDEYGQPTTQSKERVCVKWEAIPPQNFVIDTAAVNVEDALGVAHEIITPLHLIQEKQQNGEYYDGVIGPASGYTSNVLSTTSTGETLETDPLDGVYVTEYHGKLPRWMLEQLVGGSEFDDLLDETPSGGDDTDLVEAIVVIGNGSTLLKAVENPVLGHDRGFIAYQHHKCPNRFWGIGVAEKAFNAQVALDAEMRARIDVLGIVSYPLMGADASRLPRNSNLKITPGKVFLTNGRPSEVLEPLMFPNLNPASFQQSGDLERMVESATGGFNAATPVNINARNETASGVSMAAGAVIKRAKLTMHNVDQDFLDKMVRKSIWAYMQFSPERYPYNIDFTVNSTMSIMAREFEQTQLTNLLAIIPPESQPFLLVLRAIVDNMSGPSREKLVASIDQMMQPDPKKQQQQEQLQQIQLAQIMKEVQKLDSEMQLLSAQTQLALAKTQETMVKADLEDDKVEIEAAKTVIANKQAEASIKKASQKPTVAKSGTK